VTRRGRRLPFDGAGGLEGRKASASSKEDGSEYQPEKPAIDPTDDQSAPIQAAVTTRNVPMQTRERTSWNKSDMKASCFQGVFILFHFCSTVNDPAQGS
jgi:hypothetical protein